MMAERGIALSHTTILRWVQRYVPDFEQRWNRYARPVSDSWRVDETYIKVRGQWVYLYRAVDNEGRTVDFLLSKGRDVAAAQRFFSRAARQHGSPRVITLDGYVRKSGQRPWRPEVLENHLPDNNIHLRKFAPEPFLLSDADSPHMCGRGASTVPCARRWKMRSPLRDRYPSLRRPALKSRY
jgi:hypothetical protein